MVYKTLIVVRKCKLYACLCVQLLNQEIFVKTVVYIAVIVSWQC